MKNCYTREINEPRRSSHACIVNRTHDIAMRVREKEESLRLEPGSANAKCNELGKATTLSVTPRLHFYLLEINHT